MKRNRWVLVCALAIGMLILGGCINIQQEYWLKADGSATVNFDIGMSQALLSMGATSPGASTSPFEDLKKQFSATNPKIRNVQTKEYTKDELAHFSVTFDAPDFQDFLKSQTATGSGGFNITLTRSASGNLIFKQVTELDTGGASVSNGFDSKTMAPVFKDMFWTVIVHVPQVVSSNGIRMDSSTVQWKIPMADVFAGNAPAQLTLEYNQTGGAVSPLIWILIILFLLIVGAGAAYYFLIYRKHPAPARLGLSNSPSQPAPFEGSGQAAAQPINPVMVPPPGSPLLGVQPPAAQYSRTAGPAQFLPVDGYPQFPGVSPSNGGTPPADQAAPSRPNPGSPE